MKARPFNRKRNKNIIWKLICITLMFFLVGISSQAIAQQVELPPLIKFKGSDTGADGKPITLEATLVKPEGKGPFPAVIMMHGCAGDNAYLAPWQKRIVNWGYIVFRLDSLSPRPRSTFCESDHLETAKLRAQDAYDAKSYLSQLEYVDKDNVAIIGWSHGGTAALYAVDDNIPFTKKGNSFKGAVAFYPYCTEPIIKQNAPLIVLIGEKDEICKAVNCKIALASDKPSKEITLKTYKDAHHCFDWDINMVWDGRLLKYNKEAAEDAISQTQKFLSKYFN